MKPRILVVEDEALQALALKERLEELGWPVVAVAGDGERALGLLAEVRPELAVIDVRLPGMDGVALAREINQISPMPVILLTAFPDSEALERAKEAGVVHGYLVKPVDPDALAPSLELAAANFQRERELRREVEQLRQDLADRKLIERAKGILMDKLGVSEGDAWERLRSESRRRHQTLAQVARNLISAHTMMEGQGGPGGGPGD